MLPLAASPRLGFMSILIRCFEGGQENKEQQQQEQQQSSSLPPCGPDVPEVIPSPRLIWANSAEREAESSVLELTGAGGGGGPGGGGAAPAGGAGAALAPAVATGPWKSREEERSSHQLRSCHGDRARLIPKLPVEPALTVLLQVSPVV